MRERKFDAATGLERIADLVRETTQAGTRNEICARGLEIAAKSLDASGAALFLGPTGSALSVVSTWGSIAPREIADLCERCVSSGEIAEETDPGATVPRRVALPLSEDSAPEGIVVFEGPVHWGPSARSFARSAVKCLAAVLTVGRKVDEGREQGELLARRNVEMQALWELVARVQGLEHEDEMLQTALDVVLEKLGLDAGWIFWGESSGGRLELAASRGVADEFTKRARESGIGVCLCVDVFETGKLRVARNTTDCPRLPDLVRGTEPMTHACIPLKFERGILGVMNIANRPGSLFTPQELQFLETVGSQVCLAVDKARSARAESRRNAEARALASLSSAIGGSLELDRVLAAVGEYTRELLGADRSAIFLGEEPASIEFAYLAGPPMRDLDVGRMSNLEALGSRALATALRQRRTLVLHDAARDPRANSDLARIWGIGSAILVPLVARGRTEGVLMASRAAPSTWDAEEIALGGALAGQAAVAIENARLYQESKDALLRLHAAQDGMMRAERLAAIGTLASSLAHEVRNPLNSINLQLVLLSRRLARIAGGGPEEISGLVETARREISRLDSLVEEFLSLSSIDRLSLVEADPDEVVHEAVQLQEPVAKGKGLTLEEDLAGKVPRLRMDREKIKQVLINLIRNAIEATPEGGSIAVSTRQSEGAFVIRVGDTGVGIEPGIDVFDFFTTTKHGGTGLGLPIARRIVEGHGGSLTYESERGRGSVFAISLPIS